MAVNVYGLVDYLPAYNADKPSSALSEGMNIFLSFFFI